MSYASRIPTHNSRLVGHKPDNPKRPPTPARDLHGKRNHKSPLLRQLIEIGDVLVADDAGLIQNHMCLEMRGLSVVDAS